MLIQIPIFDFVYVCVEDHNCSKIFDNLKKFIVKNITTPKNIKKQVPVFLHKA